MQIIFDSSHFLMFLPHLGFFLVAGHFPALAYVKPMISGLNRRFEIRERDEYNRVLELIGNLAISQDNIHSEISS